MLTRFLVLPLVAVSLAFVGPSPEPLDLHLHLKSSSPAADAMVHEISAIELVFSESPQANSVTARVLDADEELVETPSAESKDGDGTEFAVTLTDGLAPGEYTVTWRAMGSDGHVVRGDFGFTVMSHGDVQSPGLNDR